MLSEKRRGSEDPCNDPFERPGSRLPTKKRRPKQTVAREIEEAFEDEAAVQEMVKETSFWNEDEGPEFYEESEEFDYDPEP